MSRSSSVANELTDSQEVGSGHDRDRFKFHFKLYTIPSANCDEYESSKNNSIAFLNLGEVPCYVPSLHR
jgi:hypothetical protein